MGSLRQVPQQLVPLRRQQEEQDQIHRDHPQGRENETIHHPRRSRRRLQDHLGELHQGGQGLRGAPEPAARRQGDRTGEGVDDEGRRHLRAGDTKC